MEIPKRLTPVPEVTRRLYLASGNRCAYPNCNGPLIDSRGVLVGEIAHIEGALPASARFNRQMSNEERRGYENLILMCGTDHKKIDSDKTQWTVEGLVSLKLRHEALYTTAIDQLRRQVGDITEGTTYMAAANELAIIDPVGLNQDEFDSTLKLINDLAFRLSMIPIDVRSVLTVIVHRGNLSPNIWQVQRWSEEVVIPMSFLTSIVDCSRFELDQHLQVLKHFDLVSEGADPFETERKVVAGNSTPGVGWALFQEIRTLAGVDLTFVRRILVDLDFTPFDA